MAGATERVLVRVTRHFDASADRVYDAFLDRNAAGKFMFATPTGHIVRCDIDGRVGGTFNIVDRRGDDDVAHTGTFVALERPRRIAFELSVESFSVHADPVTIDIVPLGRGCELTVTHEMKAGGAVDSEGASAGWIDILDVAAELLVDDAPTCGIGVAQHAAIPARIGVMFGHLADTLELHRSMLVADDADARTEDAIYRTLAENWRQIADQVTSTSTQMAAQRELPMGRHDETGWGPEHLQAFEKFVAAQSQVLALLRIAAERDENMLASMKGPDPTGSSDEQ